MQNKADVTGKVIEVPDIKEASALGAAILAGIGVGIYSDNIEAYERTFKSGKLYKPNGTLVKKYNEYYGIYKKLYPSLKRINREIFKSFKT
jgi:sugar (pentulose or hexulose) kinase